MQKYKHILLAVDLHPNCDEKPLLKAKSLAKENNAKLTVLHVVESFNAYGFAQAYPSMVELEANMLKEANLALQNMAKKHELVQAELITEIGSPKNIIIDKAKELDIDLMIVGSHGRHGISALLGSTANAVLHHATCDVLAVKVGKDA